MTPGHHMQEIVQKATHVEIGWDHQKSPQAGIYTIDGEVITKH